MSRFKWYRKWRGGFWVFTHFVGWQKVDAEYFRIVLRQRRDNWSLESYE